MLAGCTTPKAVVDVEPVPVTVAHLNPPCDLRYKVLDHLASKYGETVVAAGVASAGGLVEVLVNAGTDTWTIIVTAPGGPACLVASGKGWRHSQSQPKPQGTAI